MDIKEMVDEFLQIMDYERKKHISQNMSNNMKGEPAIMHCICSHPDGVTPGEISKMTEMSSARVAAALGSLEKKGLVERKLDERDRRRVQITVTEKGKTFSEEKISCLVNKVTEMLTFLGEEDSKEFIRILHKLQEWNPERK